MKQGRGAESIGPSELSRARAFADMLVLGSDRGYAGVPEDIRSREIELTSRVSALKYLRSCCSRKADPKRYDNLTRQIEAAEAELDAFIDMLWKDYISDAAVMYPRPVKLADLPLRDDWYVLVLDLLGDGVGIKLLKGKEVAEAVYTEWNNKDLEQTVLKFRDPFEQVKLGEFDPELGRMLYQRLLAPVLSKVPDGSPLVVIPDGVLAILPFEALVADGKAEWKEASWGKYPTGLTYLADRHPVRYFQSLTALALSHALQDTDEEKRKPEGACLRGPGLLDVRPPSEGDYPGSVSRERSPPVSSLWARRNKVRAPCPCWPGSRRPKNFDQSTATVR